VRAEAVAAGMKEEIVDAALADVPSSQPIILERARAQAETVLSLGNTSRGACGRRLILAGREAAATHRRCLIRSAKR